MKNTNIGIITRLSSSFGKKFISKLSSISSAILSMKGRVTMLGISRWEEKFSYKTVERFFDEKIDWLKLSWAFIKSEIGEEVILVADETTVSKSGKLTFGIDHFYSGVTNSVIKSISFLGLRIL